MKKLLICFAMLVLTNCCLAQNDSPSKVMRLCNNQKTSYVIALADDAIPAEKNAAEQLQKYLKQITAVEFPIKRETEVRASDSQILVGAGTRVKVLLRGMDWKSLGSDGIVIKTVGKNLILAGGRPRGTLYAVFQLLEDSIGCRWWTATESYIPKKNTLDVSSLNVIYIPPFNYREHYTTDVQISPEFATIMRENGKLEKQPVDWGGHYTMLGWVHTFSQLLPPEKYFKKHPNWYSDPDNGNKPCTATSKMPEAGATQLCLSNPQVLDELTKQALALIAQDPQAGYISISQNDNRNYCQDPQSMKLAEEEGSQSAPVLDFVNKVAEKIHQQYPDFKVETLAYQYTEKPPKTIRPAKNVIIRLAPIDADFGHPLNSDWNTNARNNLLAWSKIAPDLFVWNYVTNFSGNMLPHPNWKGLGSDLRFFAANNVRGVFEQGNAYTNRVGDFVELRAWLIGKLLWNPQLNQEKLTNEFLQRYYGAAAPYLKQYLDLIQQSFLSQDRALPTLNNDFSFLTLDVANRSIRLFQQATDAVKNNDILSKRVHRVRLSADIATLYRYNILKRTAAREGKEFLGPQDPNQAMRDFIEATKSFGVKLWAEGQWLNNEVPRLEGMFAPPVPLPDFAKQYSAEDVIDIQQGSYSLYRPGALTDIVNDPAASDSQAASVLGDTVEWAIKTQLGLFLDASPETWHVYAMVRAETKDNKIADTSALTCGIYDSTNHKVISDNAIPLTTVVGKQYRRIDMGTHRLNSGMLIWFAPTRNPIVTKIYVDRIILIRER